jgi:hypothetical protein
MLVTLARRLDMPKKAAMAEMSKASSSLKPGSFSVTMLASPTSQARAADEVKERITSPRPLVMNEGRLMGVGQVAAVLSARPVGGEN